MVRALGHSPTPYTPPPLYLGLKVFHSQNMERTHCSLLSEGASGLLSNYVTYNFGQKNLITIFQTQKTFKSQIWYLLDRGLALSLSTSEGLFGYPFYQVHVGLVHGAMYHHHIPPTIQYWDWKYSILGIWSVHNVHCFQREPEASSAIM